MISEREFVIKKLKWHSNNWDVPLCKTKITENTTVAYNDKFVTCKRCKKIMKKESEILGKESK